MSRMPYRLRYAALRMIVSNNKLAIEAGFAKVLYKLRILKLSCANAKPSNFGLHVCADCLVIHREYFPNPRHEKRIRRIYAYFVFLYLPASVAQPFQNAHFFLPKSEQSCFLSEVCALHHYCVHQCRIAQFVYAKGTSLQVKSIDKKCLFFTHSYCYTRLTLQFR